jgi:hypothetical protein
MSIEIKMRGCNQWRLEIRSEEWEFPTTEDLLAVASILMKLKEKHGQLNRSQDHGNA